MIKIIFSDMDGTLLTSTNNLPDGFREIISELKKRGVIFAPASGRQYFSLVSYFEKYAEDFLFIADGGAVVMRGDKEIYSNTLSWEDIKIILETANPARLRLGSIESVEITDEIISLIKTDSRICNHLHIPLQSGSDEILKSMRRPYTTKKFAELLDKITEEIPEISIGTDLIVGFPGETEENFLETVNFLESQPFNKIHVFPFSAREGTLAAKMKNQIDSQTKKFRVNKILEIARTKEKIFAEKFLNRTVEIIAETEENNFIDGLTKNYLRVYVPANKKIQLGEIINVRLEKIFRNGLLGELL